MGKVKISSLDELPDLVPKGGIDPARLSSSGYQFSDYTGVGGINPFQLMGRSAHLIPFGRFDQGILPHYGETEQEYVRNAAQSNTDVWGKGFANLGIKAVSRTLEGAGYVGGLLGYGFSGEYSDENFEQVYNNKWVNFFKELEENTIEVLPDDGKIHKSRAYTDGTLIEKMGTAGFWADDVFDGFAFAISAIAGGGGVSAGTRGALAGLRAGLTSSARGAKLVAMVGKTGLSAEGAGIGAAATWNTVMEAGFEAHDINQNIYKQLVDAGYTPTVAKQKAARAARETFVLNSVVLAFPNLIQSSIWHRAFANEASAIRRVVNNKAAISPYKQGLQDAGVSVFTEGVWEENIQTAIQNYEHNVALGKEHEGVINGVIKEYINNFSTREGHEAMVLGGIIGGIMGGLGGIRSGILKAKTHENATAALEQFANSLYTDSSIDVFKKDNQGNVILGADGVPEFNYESQINTILETVRDEQLLKEYAKALVNNDKLAGETIKADIVARTVWNAVNNPNFQDLEDVKDALKFAIQQNSKESKSPENAVLAESMSTIDTLVDVYDSIRKNTADGSELMNDTNAAFHKRVTATLYHLHNRKRVLEAQNATNPSSSLQLMIADIDTNIKNLYKKDFRNAYKKEWLNRVDTQEKLSIKREELLAESKKLNDNSTLYSKDFKTTREAEIKKELEFINNVSKQNAKLDTFVKGKWGTSPVYDNLSNSQTIRDLLHNSTANQYRYNALKAKIRENEINDRLDKGEKPVDVAQDLRQYLTLLDPTSPAMQRLAAAIEGETSFQFNEITKEYDQIEAKLLSETDPAVISQLNTRKAELELASVDVQNAIDLGTALSTSQIPADHKNMLENGNSFFQAKMYQDELSSFNELEYEVNNGLSDVDKILRTLSALQQSYEYLSWSINNSYNHNPLLDQTLLNSFDDAISRAEQALIKVQENYNNILLAQQEKLKDVAKEIGTVLGQPFFNVRDALYALETEKTKDKKKVLAEIKEQHNFLVSLQKNFFGKNLNIPKYRSNPDLELASALRLHGSGIFREMADKFKLGYNLDELIKAVSEFPSQYTDNVLTVLNRHKSIRNLDLIDSMVRSAISEKQFITTLSKVAKLNKGIVPTAEQELAIRFFVFNYHNSNTSTSDFARFYYLAGVAGTGKTSVVLKYTVDILKEINSKIVVQGIAATPTSTANLLSSIKEITSINKDELLSGDITANLIVIDEVTAFSSTELKAIHDNIQRNRKAGKKIAVFMLGDPSQLTTHSTDPNTGKLLFTPFPYLNSSLNDDIKKLEVGPSLTTVLRTNVSDIALLAEKFRQGRTINLVLKSSEPSHENAPTSIGVQGFLSVTALRQKIEATKANNRKKAIIVTPGREPLYDKYKNANTEVISFVDVQGLTFDEVFVDIGIEDFYSVNDYNRAMYVAISRARFYAATTGLENATEIVDNDLANTTKASNRFAKLSEDFNSNINYELNLFKNTVKETKQKETVVEEPGITAEGIEEATQEGPVEPFSVEEGTGIILNREIELSLENELVDVEMRRSFSDMDVDEEIPEKETVIEEEVPTEEEITKENFDIKYAELTLSYINDNPEVLIDLFPKILDFVNKNPDVFVSTIPVSLEEIHVKYQELTETVAEIQPEILEDINPDSLITEEELARSEPVTESEDTQPLIFQDIDTESVYEVPNPASFILKTLQDGQEIYFEAIHNFYPQYVEEFPVVVGVFAKSGNTYQLMGMLPIEDNSNPLFANLKNRAKALPKEDLNAIQVNSTTDKPLQLAPGRNSTLMTGTVVASSVLNYETQDDPVDTSDVGGLVPYIIKKAVEAGLGTYEELSASFNFEIFTIKDLENWNEPYTPVPGLTYATMKASNGRKIYLQLHPKPLEKHEVASLLEFLDKVKQYNSLDFVQLYGTPGFAAVAKSFKHMYKIDPVSGEREYVEFDKVAFIMAYGKIASDNFAINLTDKQYQLLHNIMYDIIPLLYGPYQTSTGFVYGTGPAQMELNNIARANSHVAGNLNRIRETYKNKDGNTVTHGKNLAGYNNSDTLLLLKQYIKHYSGLSYEEIDVKYGLKDITKFGVIQQLNRFLNEDGKNLNEQEVLAIKEGLGHVLSGLALDVQVLEKLLSFSEEGKSSIADSEYVKFNKKTKKYENVVGTTYLRKQMDLLEVSEKTISDTEWIENNLDTKITKISPTTITFRPGGSAIVPSTTETASEKKSGEIDAFGDTPIC